MKSRLVLIVGSERATQQHLSGLLADWGYDGVVSASADEALAALAHNDFVFTLLDLGLDGAGATDFLRRLGLQGGSPGPIIALSNGNGVPEAAEVAALGAEEFLPLPFAPSGLESSIKSALARPPRTWGPGLQDDPRSRLMREMDLWRSPCMLEVREIIRQAARVDVTVLVAGETGTGKDLVARAIHALSTRQAGPFVKVNCAAVPRELLESELFGHERGSFTGAHQLKIGKFEAANRGTIFLDEIGDLHPALQGKLLHVLQDGQFSRVGGRTTIKVDVRVLAATNQDLERAVSAGRFREDLYYRLNVIQITVPPLRERPEEIPLLAAYFLERFSHLFQREGTSLSPEALQRLARHRFPGNVRELENIVKRMIVLGDGTLEAGRAAAAPGDAQRPAARTSPTPVSLKDIARRAAQAAERQAILEVLEQTRWNRVKAAKLLNISYRALLYKLKEAALAPDRSPRPGF